MEVNMGTDESATSTAAQSRDILCPYTVPIYVFRDDKLDNVVSVQSGVLLRLDRRHFIVTAGHCVKDSKKSPVAFGVRNSPHRFTPTLEISDYRLDEKSDYGFWEISPQHVGEFSYQRKFVDPSHIEILNEQCLHSKEGTPALAGYPGDLIRGDWNKNPTSRFLSYITVLAGVDGTPESAFPSPPSEDRPAMDLWVSKENLGDRSNVPVLAGASGGGYWWIEPWEKGTLLTEDHCRLVAIHAKSYCDPDINERFARGYLIENHLRLIAETIPDLKDLIYRTWRDL